MSTNAEQASVAAAEQAFARIVTARNPGLFVRLVELNADDRPQQSSTKEGATRTA